MAIGRTQGWWDEFRGVLPPSFLDLAELEHHASFLRIISVAHVPGLLQTPGYARAVFSFMVPELPPQELEPRIEHRVRRRSVLETDRQTRYTAVIHESALRIKVADDTVMRRQLEELLGVSEQPHVTLRIIPLTVDRFRRSELLNAPRRRCGSPTRYGAKGLGPRQWLRSRCGGAGQAP